MKKFILVAVIATQSVQIFAATNSISSVVKWDVSARKDTQNASLMVTPLKSLEFKYMEGRHSFNSDTGAFDISTVNAENPTDVKIVTKVLKSKLARSADDSTLAVGVTLRGGEKISQNKSVVFIGEAKDRKQLSTQDNFVFTIDSATADGVTPTKFNNLTDGKWTGEVTMQFTAYWTAQ